MNNLLKDIDRDEFLRTLSEIECVPGPGALIPKEVTDSVGWQVMRHPFIGMMRGFARYIPAHLIVDARETYEAK